jgi:CheY-like chemotaxis protein
MGQTKVLIVDDEPGIRELFVDALSARGYEVFAAAEGNSAIAVAERENPDLAFVDIRMPGMDGVELLERLKAMSDTIRVVMITGHGRDGAVERAMQVGTFACLMKPFSVKDIIEMAEIVQLAA